MRQGIGSTFLYNIIIVFIVITFGFLTATLSYMKAFKVNNAVASSLERFEGYNRLSADEITKSLSTLGYRIDNTGTTKCPTKRKSGKSYSPITALSGQHRYCIYEYPKENGYFNYGIITYLYIDIPILGGTFKAAIYSETDRIYEFSR